MSDNIRNYMGGKTIESYINRNKARIDFIVKNSTPAPRHKFPMLNKTGKVATVAIGCSPCIAISAVTRLVILPFATAYSCFTGKNRLDQVAKPSCLVSQYTDMIVETSYRYMTKTDKEFFQAFKIAIENEQFQMKFVEMFNYMCIHLCEVNILDAHKVKNYRAELIVNVINECLEDMGFGVFQPNLKIKEHSVVKEWDEFFMKKLFSVEDHHNKAINSDPMALFDMNISK